MNLEKQGLKWSLAQGKFGSKRNNEEYSVLNMEWNDPSFWSRPWRMAKACGRLIKIWKEKWVRGGPLTKWVSRQINQTNQGQSPHLCDSRRLTNTFIIKDNIWTLITTLGWCLNSLSISRFIISYAGWLNSTKTVICGFTLNHGTIMATWL